MPLIVVIKNGFLHQLSSLIRYLSWVVGVGVEGHVEFKPAGMVAVAVFEVILSW
jgi:hypothetical protein